MYTKTPLRKHTESFDDLCLMFSSLMHDINHSGKTNTFEESIFSDLAIQYNDSSVRRR